MRLRLAVSGMIFAVSVIATVGVRLSASAIPPGRQYRLTIEGENTVTFLPQLGLPPGKIDYQAKIEYIVDTRFGKETKPSSETEAKTESEGEGEGDDPPVEKTSAKSTKARSSSKSARAKKNDNPALKASGAVDLSLHSSEMSFRQNGQPILERKISRNAFQGRLQPDSPIVGVTAANAPPMLQEILKTFDTITATALINDDHKVISRRFRNEGPQRAVTETILSIHAPIPKGVDSWELPTQLAMGHGQTAKGMLRFEKVKPTSPPLAKLVDTLKPGDPARPSDAARPSEAARPVDVPKSDDVAKSSDLVKVKVSGVLKAEGAIAGRFIKDGTYTVTGEQTYDSHTREWISSRWSVVIANDLANPNGQTVAHAQGTMTVQSNALDIGGKPAPEAARPKL